MARRRPGGAELLRDINFTVGNGERVALVGANGVGKTTLVSLIAGDESHRKCYGDLTPALVSALGMPGAVPPGRPGNPDSDDDWFVTDWMDTTRAQEALKFQHHSWPDMIAELRAEAG